MLDWLRETTIHAISRRLGLSWSAIDGILRRAVNRGLRRRGIASDANICVYEVAFAKGRDYVTIVSSAQRVLAVENGRSAESLQRYFDALGRRRCQALESVSMDMSVAYIKAALDTLPEASKKVAFDHFHVAKMLVEALIIRARASYIGWTTRCAATFIAAATIGCAAAHTFRTLPASACKRCQPVCSIPPWPGCSRSGRARFGIRVMTPGNRPRLGTCGLRRRAARAYPPYAVWPIRSRHVCGAFSMPCV